MNNVLEMLEATAARYPEQLAVADTHDRYSWSELEQKARIFGSGLARGITKGEPVIVLADKSVTTLAAMLGIVYAGGFYVPVSKEQPAYRMQEIISRLESKVILTDLNRFEMRKYDFFTGRIITFEEMNRWSEVNGSVLTEVRNAAGSEDILYGIFTSGSSGTPKCVTVSHRSVLDFIGHFTKAFRICQGDILGNQAPFDFDVSVKDIYSSLATGAALVLIDKSFFSMPARLIDLLINEHVTILVWAVSALTTISILGGLDYKIPTEVRTVMFSGEVMPNKQLRIWQKALPDTEFVNLYGPSEITCNCTFYRIDRQATLEEVIPIGKPFDGRQVELVNDVGEVITTPCITGEIWVSGESISGGYYHDADRTAEHFTNSVCANGKTRRTYKTGDLAHYDETHNLVFDGRKDFQIKPIDTRSFCFKTGTTKSC